MTQNISCPFSANNCGMNLFFLNLKGENENYSSKKESGSMDKNALEVPENIFFLSNEKKSAIGLRINIIIL